MAAQLTAEPPRTEVYDGNGGQRLVFKNPPVGKILGLSIDGLKIPAVVDRPDSAPPQLVGYVFTANELRLRGYVFTRRNGNVRLTYCPPETVVARTLADMADRANEIAIELQCAAAALDEAHEGDRDGTDRRGAALALLYSAREGIAELIAEVERA